jgi:SET domain-containing protein
MGNRVANPQRPHLVVADSLIQGVGVFALEPISRGTVILRVDDSRVVDEKRPLRPEDGELSIHRDFLPDGTVTLMRSPERHINHCCEPNSFIYSVDRERFLRAKHDIAAGEEIFTDYALNAVDGDEWECRCGVPACRRYHKCDFFTLAPQLQREYLPYLDPWFAQVHAERIQRLLAKSL